MAENNNRIANSSMAEDSTGFGEKSHFSQIPADMEGQKEHDSVQSTKKDKGQQYTAREAELIRELVRSRLEQNEELEFEPLSEYEVPPRTQFSMLKKPAVTIKFGMLKFNMACIRLFEGVQYIIPSINRSKKRLVSSSAPRA